MSVTPARALAVAACTAAMLLGGCEHQDDRMTERTQGAREGEEMRAGTRARGVDGVAIGYSTSAARFVRTIGGFQGPESAKYDAEQDVWFVTNMKGAGSVKDGNGYISRISAAQPESATVFVEGGRNGAVLDSPKGTALHGDTLWVADISALRGFDRHTGAPLATIDFAPVGAVLLNDIAIGPDGTIHVTDTGIMMTPKGVLHIGPDRVFVVGPNRVISTMQGTSNVGWPNGITYDAPRKRWLIVSFDPFVGRVFSLAQDAASPTVIRQGLGRLDGLEALPNGDVLFTSWADSSLHLLHGNTDRQLVRGVPEPADIGYDTRRHEVAIPLSVLGQVQIWSLDPAPARTATPRL